MYVCVCVACIYICMGSFQAWTSSRWGFPGSHLHKLSVCICQWHYQTLRGTHTHPLQSLARFLFLTWIPSNTLSKFYQANSPTNLPHILKFGASMTSCVQKIPREILQEKTTDFSQKNLLTMMYCLCISVFSWASFSHSNFKLKKIREILDNVKL